MNNARNLFLLFLAMIPINIHATLSLLTINHINRQAVLYVGNQYPQNGRMQLELLLLEGLQKYHYVLEIGCGALVAGIPIMSFLEPNHYVGIDPNKWLIEASLIVPQNTIIVDTQSPRFLHNINFDARELNIPFDYIISHSIMSHAAHWQLDLFLSMCAAVLKDGGKVVFSIRLTEPNEFGNPGAPKETHAKKWVYPGVSFFHKNTVITTALKYFKSIEHKKNYTQLISSTDKYAYHDWFTATK